jgi:putative oxidoreductase
MSTTTATLDALDFSSSQTIPRTLRRLLATDAEATGLILRLALGVMILPHGAQKLLGWFGGYGFTGTMTFFTETMGIPAVFALLAILVEFFGGLALILGVMGRFAALGVGAVMVVAAATSHLQNGFFMNWAGTQPGEGVEFFLLAIGIAVAVVIRGSGGLSVDRLLSR